MMKNILVPVDGSKNSEDAVHTAIELAQLCNAKISLLYVANINQIAINTSLTDEILDAVQKTSKFILDHMVGKIPSGIEKETFTEMGSPSAMILKFLEQHPADLVIVGSHGLGTVEGALLGSVSQYVVEQAKCPVLVVK